MTKQQQLDPPAVPGKFSEVPPTTQGCIQEALTYISTCTNLWHFSSFNFSLRKLSHSPLTNSMSNQVLQCLFAMWILHPFFSDIPVSARKQLRLLLQTSHKNEKTAVMLFWSKTFFHFLSEHDSTTLRRIYSEGNIACSTSRFAQLYSSIRLVFCITAVSLDSMLSTWLEIQPPVGIHNGNFYSF